MTEQLQTTWGERTSHIEQTLLDKARLPPRSLDGVLQRLATAGPGEIDAALAAVAEFTGPTRLVMEKPTPDGGKWMLVGLGGRSSIFDARFAVIRVQKGQPVVHDVIEVPLGPEDWLNDTDNEASATMLRGRVTPSALAMRSCSNRRIWSLRRFTFARLKFRKTATRVSGKPPTQRAVVRDHGGGDVG